jgi:acetylornithine deacetylase/succinyl-diaminopimelate desuccinylase-like protein
MDRGPVVVSVVPRSTRRVALGPTQRDWVEEASGKVDEERLRELATLVTSIPSPTGGEGSLARAIAQTCAAAGCEAEVQRLDADQANALARIPGAGGGVGLLLYAPIDTLTSGDPALDVPWIGPELRADMRAEASVDGPFVSGLGASNPKGHAACVLAAIEAISAAGVPLRGDVLAGFGSGGMPTNGWDRRHVGHGAGCAAMLDRISPDFAVIAKPGWTVSWEEVGFIWVEVRTHGTHTYVGSRHRLPYRNALADAARVIDGLEAWFPEYARRHTESTVAPQGIVAAARGGWWHMAAVTPATCRLLVDLRISPRTDPADAHRELADVLARIADRHDLSVTHELVLAIPGTASPVESPVVEASVEAWEAIEGRDHVVILENSGATDANILRGRGVPTVRVGMPKVSDLPGAPTLDFQRGMNTVDVREMTRLTHLLIRVAINLCTRDAAELCNR